MATPIPVNHAKFRLADIVEATGGSVTQGKPDLALDGVTTDSRQVVVGNLYVALSGERHDGHAFVAEAIERGARAVLVAHAVEVARGVAVVQVPDTLRALGALAAMHRRRWGGLVVAITGSAGKTTTKELAHACLDAAGFRPFRSAGNLNNLIGVPMSLLCLDATVETAVIEIGTNAPGEIARLAEIALPDVGVVTSVSIAHTQGLGSLEAVAAEKASLLWALPENGAAIYDADSTALAPHLARVRATRKFGFGRGAEADVQLLGATVDKSLVSRCAFRVGEPTNVLRAEMKLFGPGPAIDAAAALAVVYAVAGRAALASAVDGLVRVEPTEGRLCPRLGPDDILIVDDTYNANPASTAASIQAAAEIAWARDARFVAILGDMLELGAQSREAHEEVGRTVVRAGAGALFTCGMEMRSASQAAWETAHAEEIPAPELAHVADAPELLARVQKRLQPRDVVLVKGSRGMGMERIVAGLLAGAGRGAA